jgi:hypothetical protein
MLLANSTSTDWLAGPFFVAAGLLLVAGVAKLLRPGPAARALSSAGLRGSPRIARVLGVVELIVGGACLVRPSRPFAWAMAVTYLAFAGFLSYLMVARVPEASCGCLGRREVPPSWLHVLLNLVAVVTATLAALDPSPGLPALVAKLPLYGVPFLIGGGALGYAAYLTVALLPEVFRTLRPTDAKPEGAVHPRAGLFAFEREARA